MIKKYKQFNEGVLDYMKGPNENDLLYSFHNDLKELKKLSGKGLNKIDILYSYCIDHNSVTVADVLDAISGLTPTQQMIICSYYNFKEGLVNAVNNGADIHADDDYCYRAACFRNDYEVGKFFLEKGVEPIKGLRYIKGNSPLRDLVLEYDWKDTIKRKREYALKHKDDIKESLLDKLQGPSKEEVIDNLNTIESTKELLNVIIDNYLIEGVKLISERKDGIEFLSLYLYKAVDTNNIELVKEFLKYGAYINDDEMGCALFQALQLKNQDILILLLENGADVNIWGSTLLSNEIHHGRIGNSELLIKYGADINQISEAEMLKLSEEKYHKQIKELFSKYKTNEGILNHLKGPSEDDVWNNLGYDRTFDTAEEFLDYMVKNLKKVEVGYITRWLFNNEKTFLHYEDTGIFYYNEKIFDVLRKMFDLDDNDINIIVNREVVSKLNIIPRPNPNSIQLNIWM